MSRRQLAGFIALCLIWGSTWAAIRIVVMHMPPLLSVSIRFLLASLILLPVMLVRRPRMPKGREWGVISVLGLVMIVLPFSLVAWAEQRISSGTVAILFATSPLFTAWMEPRLGHRSQRKSVPRMTQFALWGGLGGVSLVLSQTVSLTASQIIGVAAVLTVVILGSATATVAKSELKSMPLLTVTTVQFIFAGGILWLTSHIVERRHPTMWTPSTVLATAFLGVVSSALGFLLFYWLLAELRPYQLASKQLLMPVIAIAEGVLLLHEPLSWTTVVGTMVALGCLILVMRVRVEENDAQNMQRQFQ